MVLGFLYWAFSSGPAPSGCGISPSSSNFSDLIHLFLKPISSRMVSLIQFLLQLAGFFCSVLPQEGHGGRQEQAGRGSLRSSILQDSPQLGLHPLIEGIRGIQFIYYFLLLYSYFLFFSFFLFF